MMVIVVETEMETGGEGEGKGCMSTHSDVDTSVQLSRSIVSSSCDPVDCSTPGLPVQLPEPAQTHGHRVGDAIQPSHALSPPSPSALNLSQHQGLFQ